MLMAIASAISESLCGVLNTHFVFGFAGSTMRDDAAIEIIGVSASATTSTIASELGVIVEPTTTSTLSSEMSFFVLVTALVVSEPSSRTIQLTFWPPIVAGRSSNVFFSGMPSDAAGPVADNVTPTLMSAMREERNAAGGDGERRDQFRQGTDVHFRFLRDFDEAMTFALRGPASSIPPRGLPLQCIANFAQQHDVFRRGCGAAGGGRLRFSRLICRTMRKMMNARMRKLIAMVMKLP